MLVQIGLEGESLVTADAHKWLGVGVGLDMCPQIGLVGKSFFANVAPKGLLTCNKSVQIDIIKARNLGETISSYESCFDIFSR